MNLNNCSLYFLFYTDLIVTESLHKTGNCKFLRSAGVDNGDYVRITPVSWKRKWINCLIWRAVGRKGKVKMECGLLCWFPVMNCDYLTARCLKHRSQSAMKIERGPGKERSVPVKSDLTESKSHFSPLYT